MKTLGIEMRLLAGATYLFWPLSLLIVLTTLKKDSFLRFHGYQALFLGICASVTYLVGGAFLKLIPFLGPLILRLAVAIWVLFVLFLAYRCSRGDFFRVPLIYELAEGSME